MKFHHQQAAPTKNIVVFLDPKGQLILPDNWPAHFKDRWTSFLALSDVKSDTEAVHQLFDPELERVYLVSGPKKLDPRSLGGKLGRLFKKTSFPELAFLLPASSNLPIFSQFESFLEGFFLGRYEYSEFKSKPKTKDHLKSILFLSSEKQSWVSTAKQSWVWAEATNQSRDLGNKPGNHLRPVDLMTACQEMAKTHGLSFEALDEKQMEIEKMGCLLGVSKGSEEPAFLNIMEYHHSASAQTLMLVGKGLTFDAGGISLKPAGGMEEMKHDMCGGSAVFGAMKIIAQLKPAINVIALIPASENLPDGKANKPGDVLTACDGTTVEILNTDAEGRLILADAIAYGIKRYQPDAVVDVATLTGACMVALGHYHSGYQCNQTALSQQIEKAAQRTGDPVWRMPHAEVYFKDIEGHLSDLKNAGVREGGMITAGLFLQHFAGKVPWAHIDIAGTAWSAERIPYYPAKGATGTATRLLADLALNWKS